MNSSDIYVVKRKILWKISNVIQETLTTNKFLQSRNFKTFIGSDEIKWFLRVKFSDDNTIGFHLVRDSFLTNEFNVTQKLLILGSNNEIIKIKETCYESKNFPIGRSVGWEIGTFQEILIKENKYLTSFNTLTFSFELTLVQKQRKIKLFETNKLLLNYFKFFNSSEYSDFTCISSDGKKFPIHRCILATQSSVFDKMFKADMSESKSSTVKIDDIDGDTLLEVLRFIYTGQVQNVKELASSLIYAAEKYEINELKKLCTLSLIENLSLENVLETLILEIIFENRLLNECMQIVIKKYHLLRNDNVWNKMKATLFIKIMDIMEQDHDKVIEFSDSLRMHWMNEHNYTHKPKTLNYQQ